MNTLVGDALSYAELGWYVLPLRGKLPAIPKREGGKGWKDATTDAVRIKQWWQDNTSANIGIACATSGLVVLDVDPRNDGRKTLQEVCNGRPALRTATVETGGGGQHFYFRAEHAGRYRGMIGPGLDVKYQGYVVAPPSIHPKTERAYCWSRAPEHIDVAPEWLCRLMLNNRSPPKPGGTERTERTETASVDSVHSVPEEVREMILQTAPRAPGHRNQGVFEFARLVKAHPAYAEADARDLRRIVVEWHKRALPTISTKPFEDTWADFVRAWASVKYPAGQGPIDLMMKQIAMSTTVDRLAERLGYDAPETHQLIALCRELQRVAGAAPFFLSARKAAEILHISPMTAWRRLHVMAADGVIKIEEPGTTTRATRFRFNAPEQTGTA